MYFRALGPLEVSHNDRTVSVGRNRQLTVLALLLLEVNKSVSVDRLTKAVWGDHPPKTAAEQIQTCIWRLRKLFVKAGAANELIETTASGYVLRVSEDRVDTCVFAQEMFDAKLAAANGDYAAAILGYRRAVRLFRGPVLAEVCSPLVHAIASKWEERRLSVLEECIELELTAGMDRELVDELIVLVDEHPLRERLRAQLMLSLWRSDRRAEALATYREGRRAMVAQLGLEPGSRLRELHHAILAGELDTPVVKAVAMPSPTRVPAQVPADVPDFVGRAAPATEILRLMAAGGGGETRARGRGSIYAILGKAGVGKTALAIHVAHEARDRFPDGQLYVDLGGARGTSVDPGEVLLGFLRALGVAETQIPSDLHGRAALYRGVLAKQRVLVVLDDVADTAQARPLLPGGRNTAVLITSRANPTDLPGIHPIEVDALSDDEALQLLTRIVGENRVLAEPEAARRIVRAAGYLPLSIRAVGARLAARRRLAFAHLADQLGDPDRRLDELTHGALDVRKSLASSLHGLPLEAKRLWCVVSLLQVPDFAAWTAAVAGDIPVRAAEKLLEVLVDRRLVDIVGMDPMGLVRYRLDDLSGLYAREQSRKELPEAVRGRVLDQAADCWVALAECAYLALRGEERGRIRLDCRVTPTDSVLDMVLAGPQLWLRVERSGLEFAVRHSRRQARVVAPHDVERVAGFRR